MSEETIVADRWTKHELIGKGGSAEVFRVKNVSTQGIFACKISTNIDNEIVIHSKVVHPNIIKYIGCYTLGLADSSCMILELASEGDIYEKLAAGPIDLEKIKKWSTEIIEAMIYLKSQGILHCDIKLENMLLQNDVAKLADFGLACFEKDACKLKILNGTPSYIAPEIICHRAYSYQSDVWALGISMYAMITRRFPFKGYGWKLNIVQGNYMKILEVEALLELDPTERVQIEDVLQLNFFRDESDRTKKKARIENQ